MSGAGDALRSAVALAERLAASAASRQGPSHDRNEDSYLAIPEAGLFCVADGLGGHLDGQLASRAITSILERVVDPLHPLEARLEDVESALLSINAALIRAAERTSRDVVIGSTVAAVLLDHAFGICLWAGDSRCYLARGAHLFQLTRDHAIRRERGTGTMLTRAIGSKPDLELERVVFAVEPGDVLLVCSDGLNAGLPTAAIHTLLAREGTDARALVDAAVEGGSRDDVTCVLVHVGPAP